MPRPKKTIENDELLEAALAGLQLKRQQLDEQIREVRALLGGTAGRRAQSAAAHKNGGSSRLSPAARKRIAAAQKRRWAEYRKSASKAE